VEEDAVSLLIRADNRRLPLATGSVDCVVTSPGYWGQRAYGSHLAEIGRRSLAEYVAEETLGWAREVGRVLDDRGLFWLNIADTRSNSGGAGGDYMKGGTKEGQARYRQGTAGLPGHQACLVPERVILALQEDGWYVVSKIIWDKQQCRQEDIRHVRRPLLAHEIIYVLAKKKGYHFFHDRLTEAGDVWHFPPQRGKRVGPAPFPDELARRAILVSTEPGDIVLDPAVGSGTTSRVAEVLGRRAVGVDLYADPAVGAVLVRQQRRRLNP
jgi:DNA modification methylase